MNTRTETDSMGAIEVPADRYYRFLLGSVN